MSDDEYDLYSSKEVWPKGIDINNKPFMDLFSYEFEIFPDECGVKFCESSSLDIAYASVVARIKEDSNNNFEVEFVKIQAAIQMGQNEKAIVHGYIDVTNTCRKETKEGFKERIIQICLEKEQRKGK